MTKNKPCTLWNAKTEWPYFQELLKTTLDNSIPLKTDDDITCAVERNHAVQQAAWRATPTAIQKSIYDRILTGNQRKNSREKEAPLWRLKKASYGRLINAQS